MRIDVDHLAALSGLSLSETEKISLEADMEELIAFADRIKESDGQKNNSLPFFPHGEINALREDVPMESISSEELLMAASEKKDGYITVPRVLSEKGGQK